MTIGARIFSIVVAITLGGAFCPVWSQSDEPSAGPEPEQEGPAVEAPPPATEKPEEKPTVKDPDAPAANSNEKNVPAAEESPKAEKEPAKESEEARGTVLGNGLKGVVNFLSGDSQASTSEALEKGSSEETQKRVNELVRSATINAEKGRLQEAMRNITELITLKPYEADYHFALGLCYRKEGKYKEALKKYQDVLDLGGPKALVALLKAEAFASESRTDKVFESLKEAAIGGRNIINDVGILPLLSSYQHDTEFIKLALHLENFVVSASKNHDPFTNPFPRPDARGVKQPEETSGEVSFSPEDQDKMLLEAKKLYERVLFYIKLDDDTKAMKAYTALRDLTKKKDLLTIPKLVNDFRILIARLEELEVQIEGIRLKYYYSQGQSKLKQMKEFFTDGEYQRVEMVHAEVMKLTQEMEQTNTRYKPVADQILALSNRWLTRAQVRQEFQSHKPNIQGIVISENAKMAVLNDRVIKQGEAMDDFRLLKVESNKITFRYKGEEIPLVFRRY